MPDIAKMPDLDAAMAKLAAAEAAETAPYTEHFVQTEADTTREPVAQPPAGTMAGRENESNFHPTDTPAAAAREAQPVAHKETQGPESRGEKNPGELNPAGQEQGREATEAPESDPHAKTPEDQKPEGTPENTPDKARDGRSHYAKNTERLEKTWKAVNERKGQLDARERQLGAREQAVQQAEQRFAERQSLARARVTPEQNEQAAQQKLAQAGSFAEQAEAWEARAQKLEGEGRFQEADRAKGNAKSLRQQAHQAEALAELYRQNAEHTRRHPDPTLAQVRERKQAELRNWTLEAARHWPDVARTGSEFQKVMAGHLQTAARQGLDPGEFPMMVYHAARLTAAETAAARVPGMERELGELRAKVKDLEALTSPGGGKGAVQRVETAVRQLTDEEEYAELRSQAMQM